MGFKSNNKTIAKNTLFLYLRMIFLLFVSLFTSRIILAQLGVVDFGLYNVVGSLILMFTFVQGSLSSATSRFLAYDIGRENEKVLNNTFCMTLNVHLLFSFIVLLVAETIGLWYFYQKMVIPQGRFFAALVVYQLSAFNAIMAIVIIPYRSMIIAKEKMGAFAYISIVEALIKLGIAFCLYYDGIDRLVLYALLLCLSQVVVNCVYLRYCKRNFFEVSYHKYWDRKQFLEMFSFSGWSVCSYLSSSFVSQTYNLLLNLFFGPAVNAARAVAYQVQSAVSNFSTNFQVALNPQIIKNYAAGDGERLNELIQLSIKVSFSLLLILLAPLLINVNFVLGIWLKDVPEYSANFLVIIGLCSIFSGLSNPLSVIAEAANRLKFYNLVTMPFYLMTIPLAYVLLKTGSPAYVVFYITLCAEFLGFFIKLWIASRITQICVGKLLIVFFRVLSCILVVVVIGAYARTWDAINVLYSVLSIMCCGLLSVSLVYSIVLNRTERYVLNSKLTKVWKKIK